MNSIKLLPLILICSIAILCSCNKEEYKKLGDWDSMEWKPKHTIYDDAYTIPADGDTIVFICQNYTPWIDGASTNYEFTNNNYNHIEGEWFSAFFDDNVFTIVFSENIGVERNVKIDVTAGDIFDVFVFTQYGKDSTTK